VPGAPRRDNEVSESAEGHANEVVKGVKIGLFNLPIGCKTVEPIDLPLTIKEPTNAEQGGPSDGGAPLRLHGDALGPAAARGRTR
jgi:hypothetical protein